MMAELEKCRGCSCTNDRACPGGCHWAKPGLCSVCFQEQLDQIELQIEAWLHQCVEVSTEIEATLASRPCRITVEPGPILTVRDHLGLVVLLMDADRLFIAPQYDVSDLSPLFESEARAA